MLESKTSAAKIRSDELENVADLAAYWGVKLATKPVCIGHDSPAEFLREQIIDRPPISLWQGARGVGKSFISGLGAWMDSLAYDNHGTRILGGSKDQSAQAYEAMRYFDRTRPYQSPVVLTKTRASFVTGSEVTMLASSETAVRGPHVARLRLDEVDEIPVDRRESAMGMCMSIDSVPASVVMTSTWHRVGGPMAELMERGQNGEFPVHTVCIFDVLERCPDERSGENLERCPECPLLDHCHSDRDSHPSGLPKAKRASGHYGIDSLIQKIKSVSSRVFASDYLCDGPRAAGSWFTNWSERNVSPEADLDTSLPIHVAVDSGVFTAAVFFQARHQKTRDGSPEITVFDEYLTEGLTAESNAIAINAKCAERFPGLRRVISTDPAGGARNPVGPTVLAEYERAGLRGEGGFRHWPCFAGSVTAGLTTLENLVRSADGGVHLKVHPRCVRLIAAMKSYARAKRAGQWQDYPQDPQHPHEDLVDALRGGVAVELPQGRKPQPNFYQVKAGRLF